MKIFERVSECALVRRSADSVLRTCAQRRVRMLDGLDVAKTQEQTLRRLLRRASQTRFGRAHGFDRIRSVADYRLRVPLRDYEAFWKEYWQASFPHLVHETWSGRVPYLALSSGTTSGTTKYIPVSGSMLASNRRAAWTALSWFRAAHPAAAIFTGRIFFLGGSTALTPPDTSTDAPLAGDLSGIAAREVADVLRPFTFPPLETALIPDWDEKLTRLAESSARMPITLLSGVPSWLLALFERLRQVTGRACLADIWPGLRLVVHGGTRFDPYRRLFRALLGSDAIHLQETYPASEGFVGAEDPRFPGLLRLIPDHDVFFEFVPVEELHQDRPTRHTIREVEPGVSYAVVLTTCAGLWSYVLGDIVAFERGNPPLFRFRGRIRQHLSAFGEHLIGEEVEQAVAEAARLVGADVVDFHVGPVFPDLPSKPGRHRFFVEFAQANVASNAFAQALDRGLCQRNEDYRAHRSGDITMLAPDVRIVPPGFFTAWMRSRGQLGGQHKVPRLDSTGQQTLALEDWLRDMPLTSEPDCSGVIRDLPRARALAGRLS